MAGNTLNGGSESPISAEEYRQRTRERAHPFIGHEGVGSRISIRPSDVGKRVTVQYFMTDGSKQEAVGFLEHASIVDGEVVCEADMMCVVRPPIA